MHYVPVMKLVRQSQTKIAFCNREIREPSDHAISHIIPYSLKYSLLTLELLWSCLKSLKSLLRRELKEEK